MSEKRTGTTIDDYLAVLQRSMDDFQYDLLFGLKEETHAKYSNTGYLADNLTGRRTPRGGVIIAPPGRLEAPQTLTQWEERVAKPFLAFFLGRMV